MGFGNVLYLVLEAWIERQHGAKRRVLETNGMQRWLKTFPAMRDTGLTVSKDEVNFFAVRDKPWLTNRGNEEYTTPELEQFIREMFLTADLFRQAEPGRRGLDSPESLTINVRRGDYYSVPEFEKLFGFDQLEYLKLAVAGSLAAAPSTRRIYVVSDGIDWCKEHLAWLSELVDVVDYASPDDSPQDNMLDVATSRRLIMTNSTFTYWCGYISNVIYGDNHADIWAPRFFARFGDDSSSKQLDARWSIVEDLPGGWDRTY